MQPDTDDYLALTDEQLLRQCEVDTIRGSGRGGQKRNKTETMVRVRHRPTGLQGLSDDTRSQHQNKREALRRLRRRLALDRRQPVQLEGWAPPEALRKLLTPTKGEVIGRKNPLYLPAVAALLDLFVALECSVGDTARRLGLSTGAMSRLLLADEHLGRCVNVLRAGRELRPLR
jgi:RF-1 domain